MRPMGRFPTARRIPTTTATQALLLINAIGAWLAPRPWPPGLERLAPDSSDDLDRIALAYRLTCGRQAEHDEIMQAKAFLESQARLARPSAQPSNLASDHAALVDFCHAS